MNKPIGPLTFVVLVWGCIIAVGYVFGSLLAYTKTTTVEERNACYKYYSRGLGPAPQHKCPGLLAALRQRS